MSDDVMITAAIDFGTMYSGYSYSFKSNPDDIRVNKEWASRDVGTTVNKAPTCVLIKQTEQKEQPTLLAFGFDAQQKYRERKSDDKDVHFYDEFKMALYKDKNLGRPDYKKTIRSLDGTHECDATTIFSMTLAHLKQHLLDSINDKLENKLAEKNIQWVLTVPAIWSDAAKRFMRQCAKEGGMIEDEDSERLLVSLEPECAAMYCRQLKADKIKNPPEGFNKIPENAKYMVVDCGGGTVDITAHEMKDEDDICELFARSSKDWGGRNIDRQFEDTLEKVMGEELYTKFYKDLTPKFLELKNEFEKRKGTIEFDNTSYKLNIPLPYDLEVLCKKEKGKGFAKYVNERSNYDENASDVDVAKVSVRQDTLSFNWKAIDDMFDPIVSKICNNVVYDLLERHSDKGIQYIFLAGGFSDCGSLQRTMKNKIDLSTNKLIKGVTILTPDEAVLTIMKGAVQFGYNPQAISSRRSRLTYGTCVHEKYDPKKHNTDYRVIGKDGQLYCSNIFYPLLGKEDIILQDDVLDFVFQPLWNEQDEVEFYLYSIDKKIEDVKYVTDPNMIKRTIPVKLDKGADYSEKPIRLLLYFGSTELHVQVVDDNDPHTKKGEASLDLLES